MIVLLIDRQRCEEAGSGICFSHEQKVIVTHQNYYAAGSLGQSDQFVFISQHSFACVLFTSISSLSALTPKRTHLFCDLPWRLWLRLRIEVVLHTNVG